MKKTICILLCIFILSSVLVSCGVKEEDIIGTWSGKYTFEGNNYSVVLTINETTFSSITFKNEIINSVKSGDYEIKGNTVILYDDSATVYHGIRQKYTYKNGTLENNGHKLTKE